MASTPELEDWFVILQELSLPRSLSEFALATGQIASEFCAAKNAWYYSFEGNENLPGAPELASRCAQLCEAQLLTDDPGAGNSNLESPALAVPVRHFGTLVGVLVFSGLADTSQPTQALAHQLAKLLGVMQQAARVQGDMGNLLARTEEFVVRATDGHTGGHVARVAQISAELATILDLSAQVRQRLWSASQMHDIGEISLRHRPSEARNFHARAGSQFLKCCTTLAPLAQLVETHHEKYDGTGFPQGRRGDDLPIENWVLSMAEDLDEFWQGHTSMSYSEKLSLFFEERAGSHHPSVVGALSSLADSGRLGDILT